MSTTRDTDNIRQFPTPTPDPDEDEDEFRDQWIPWSTAEVQDTGTDTTGPAAVPSRRIVYVADAVAAVDEAAEWWRTASRESRIIVAIAAAAGVVAVLVLTSEAAELAAELVRWILGRGGDGYAALSGTDIGGTIADPVTSYLTVHSVGLPAAGSVVTLWAITAAACWIGSVAGWRGARIGWSVVLVATAWMVYAGTPAPGREAAVAVTVAVAVLASIPAYRRLRPRED